MFIIRNSPKGVIGVVHETENNHSKRGGGGVVMVQLGGEEKCLT